MDYLSDGFVAGGGQQRRETFRPVGYRRTPKHGGGAHPGIDSPDALEEFLATACIGSDTNMPLFSPPGYAKRKTVPLVLHHVEVRPGHSAWKARGTVFTATVFIPADSPGAHMCDMLDDFSVQAGIACHRFFRVPYSACRTGSRPVPTASIRLTWFARNGPPPPLTDNQSLHGSVAWYAHNDVVYMNLCLQRVSQDTAPRPLGASLRSGHVQAGAHAPPPTRLRQNPLSTDMSPKQVSAPQPSSPQASPPPPVCRSPPRETKPGVVFDLVEFWLALENAASAAGINLPDTEAAPAINAICMQLPGGGRMEVGPAHYVYTQGAVTEYIVSTPMGASIQGVGATHTPLPFGRQHWAGAIIRYALAQIKRGPVFAPVS